MAEITRHNLATELQINPHQFRRRPDRRYPILHLPNSKSVTTQSGSGEILLADAVQVGKGICIIPSPGQSVMVEGDTNLGSNVLIYAKNNLVIPGGCTIGEGTMLMDRNFHGIGASRVEEHAPIVVEPGTQIGRQSIVLKGVQLLGEYPAYSIVTQSGVRVAEEQFTPVIEACYETEMAMHERGNDDMLPLIIDGDPSSVRFEKKGDEGFCAYPYAGLITGQGIDVGYGTFMNYASVVDASSSPVRIGAHCSIAFRSYIGASPKDNDQPTTIGDQVWVGAGSVVLSGVTVGKGSVIAAGSIVTKDIPEFSIAAGRPAKVIREIPVFTGGHGRSRR